jgi:phospholipase/carboxylesterase
MTTALDSHIHLFRPGKAGDPRTLLMLHGTGGDEVSFAGLGPVLAPGAAVVSVRGNVDEHGISRFFRRLAEGVYDMADLGFRTRALESFVEAVIQNYKIEQDHLIGVGYSNGANILANLLFQSPLLLAAAVLMHPLIPFTPQDQPGLAGRRLLITAGERDPICPPAMTRALYDYFERQGTAAQLVFHPGGHELQESELGAIRSFVASFQSLEATQRPCHGQGS